MLKSKKPRILAGALAAALSAATMSAQGSVSLVDYTETVTSFSAKYAFTPDITLTDGVSILGDYWETLLNQTHEPAVSGVSEATWTFEWQGAHLATPHDDELPLLLTTLGTCSITAGLTGTYCDTTTQVPHLLGHHYDEYRFWLELTNSSGYAYFTGTHVSEIPVPAAAWLLGSGLLGLIGVARRKMTQA